MSERESKMVVIERNADGEPTVWCDPEIATIVAALNAAGIRTIASCSGHGYRPGSIVLADGRNLIIARDLNEGIAITAHYPDVNGQPPADDQARRDALLRRASLLIEYLRGADQHRRESACYELQQVCESLATQAASAAEGEGHA